MCIRDRTSDEADPPLDYEDYESLSDLSEDEFMEERAGSASGPAASMDEGSSPESEYSEEYLLEANCSEQADFIKPEYCRQLAVPGTTTPPSSPVSQAEEDAEVEPTTWSTFMVNLQDCEHPTTKQECNPAKEFDEWIAELPSPPLAATLKRWRKRSASPTTMDYIRNRRRGSENGLAIYIPYNVRDILDAKKERDLAKGPRSNRRFLIEEYRLKKQREAWDLLDEQNGFNSKK